MKIEFDEKDLEYEAKTVADILEKRIYTNITMSASFDAMCSHAGRLVTDMVNEKAFTNEVMFKLSEAFKGEALDKVLSKMKEQLLREILQENTARIERFKKDILRTAMNRLQEDEKRIYEDLIYEKVG